MVRLAGISVILDGTRSFDPDGDDGALQYAWQLLQAPAGSSASIQGAALPAPALIDVDASGDYVLELVVSDAQEAGAPAIATVTAVPSSPIALAITHPAPSAVLPYDRTIVRGTVTAPSANVGVMVNGVAAAVQGGEFVASDVPVRSGIGVLTAIANADTGESLSVSQYVFGQGGSAPLTVTPDPASGLAPLDVTFDLAFAEPTVVQSLEVDFDGDGAFATLTPGAPITHTYTTEGLFVATVRVTNDESVTVEALTTVYVVSLTEANGLFRAMWDAMNAALVAQDQPTALTYLTPDAQEKLGPAWDVLLDSMGGPSGIVASFGAPIEPVWISSGFAQYGVTREIDGVERLYLISFIRDASGVWRLEDM
jgi:PKD repeat protein